MLSDQCKTQLLYYTVDFFFLDFLDFCDQNTKRNFSWIFEIFGSRLKTCFVKIISGKNDNLSEMIMICSTKMSLFNSSVLIIDHF